MALFPCNIESSGGTMSYSWNWTLSGQGTTCSTRSTLDNSSHMIKSIKYVSKTVNVSGASVAIQINNTTISVGSSVDVSSMDSIDIKHSCTLSGGVLRTSTVVLDIN